jgi:FPC/CPF motif-containing protein YcgG
VPELQVSYDFREFISSAAFPCVGAKSALATRTMTTMEAEEFACPESDDELYRRVAAFGRELDEETPALRTFACLFRSGPVMDEVRFEQLFWRRLQALHDIDFGKGVEWAKGVASDPTSPQFSMSIGGRAFFVVGLHPGASRPARRFSRPALVFNAHAQFQQLRGDGRYPKLQSVVRQREIAAGHGVNPMLAEFGDQTEAAQYAGRRVGAEWTCPLKVRA